MTTRAVCIQFPEQHFELLEKLCLAAGWQLDRFESAVAAFDQIQNGDYVCVISALTMEDMDGIELINLTRTLFPEIRILAVNNFDRGSTDFGKVACRVGADVAVNVQQLADELPASFATLIAQRQGDP